MSCNYLHSPVSLYITKWAEGKVDEAIGRIVTGPAVRKAFGVPVSATSANTRVSKAIVRVSGIFCCQFFTVCYHVVDFTKLVP